MAVLLSGCGFVNAGKQDDDAAVDSPGALAVSSPAFDEGAAIPREFTCKGANTSPPLAWSGVPAGARSVALVVDDPDAPNGGYIHWVVYNIDPTVSAVAAGEVPSGAAQADNSAAKLGYTGPCPPSGTHHYRFTVYVLRSALTVPAGGDPVRVFVAIKGKTTASGTLTGTFSAG
jgi:Raf kinase inhibitor-like YbhB/YbcL family protein